MSQNEGRVARLPISLALPLLALAVSTLLLRLLVAVVRLTGLAAESVAAPWDWWDRLVQIAAQVACALHWFNPLVWRLARRLVLEVGHASDNQVLRAGAGAEGYAERLVILARAVRGAGPPAALSIAPSSGLAHRVIASWIRSAAAADRAGSLRPAPPAQPSPSFCWPSAGCPGAPRPRGRAHPARLHRCHPPMPCRPCIAQREGDAAEVRRLLAAGADPDVYVPGVGTAHRRAIVMDRVEAARVLLAAEAEPLPEPMRKEAVEQALGQAGAESRRQVLESARRGRR